MILEKELLLPASHGRVIRSLQKQFEVHYSTDRMIVHRWKYLRKLSSQQIPPKVRLCNA